MNVFWDLDGTIVDCRKRLYKLFCTLTGGEVLNFNKYWLYKNKGYNQNEMLGLVGYKNSDDIFRQMWLKKIELPEWLILDELQPGVNDVLEGLNRVGFKQYIVTNRQNIEGTLGELERLGIKRFFFEVLVTQQQCDKVSLIKRQRELVISSSDFFIGDSPEDIMTAKTLNVHSIAVASDEMRGDALKKYNPEYIITNRRCVLDIIKHRNEICS